MNGIEVFEFQVAGSHSASTSNLLRGEFGRVLKPYKLKATSTLRTNSSDKLHLNKETLNTENEGFDRHGVVCEDEREFYELCDREEAQLAPLRMLIPAYYGETTVHAHGSTTRYLVLEDLTAHCGLPCVADLKMGVSRDYPGKHPRKLVADEEKYPSLGDTGWCIAGLLQHAPHGPLIHKFGPSTGRGFSTQQVHDHMTEFIGGVRGSAKRRQLVQRVRSVLEDIQKWFNGQRRFWFRSSSILIVYNAEYFTEELTDTSESNLVDGSTDNPNPGLQADQAERGSVNSCRERTPHHHRVDPTLAIDAAGFVGKEHSPLADEQHVDGEIVFESQSKIFYLNLSTDTTKINCSGDQPDGTSALLRLAQDNSRVTRTNPKSPVVSHGFPSPDEVSGQSIPVSEATISLTPNTETGPASGSVPLATAKSDQEMVLGTSHDPGSTSGFGIQEDERPPKPNLDDCGDQRIEPLPKKMRLDSSLASGQGNDKKECRFNSGSLIVRVKMIDFAHVLEAAGEPDRGYTTGLNNLLEFVRNIG